MGYKVLCAMSGAEAVKLYQARAGTIDLVLLDMIMPSMGGDQVFDRIKQINSSVKVLLLSGYSINGEALEIIERGCDGFIQKPFNMEQLS